MTEATKTWHVSNLPKSRHPHLDGESVSIDQPFSNGLQYPGDPSDPDESSGCQCYIDTWIENDLGKYKIVLDKKGHTKLPDFATPDLLENKEWGKVINDLLQGKDVPEAPEGFLTWWDVISYLLLKSTDSSMFNLKHFGPTLGPHYHPHKGPFDKLGNIIQWVDQFGNEFTNKPNTPASNLDPADHTAAELHPSAPTPTAADPDLGNYADEWDKWRVEVGIEDERRQWEKFPTQEEAWRRYTSLYHKEYPDFLIKGDDSKPLIAEHVDQLDALIKMRALKQDTVAYRGWRGAEVGGLKVGDPYPRSSYTSVSFDEEAAGYGFGDLPETMDDADFDRKIVELHIPAGTNYAFGYKNESELILPRGLNFVVTEVTADKVVLQVENQPATSVATSELRDGVWQNEGWDYKGKQALANDFISEQAGLDKWVPVGEAWTDTGDYDYEEQKVVSEYTEFGFIKINGLLRGQEVVKDSEKEGVQQQIELFRSAQKKHALTQDVEADRWLRMDDLGEGKEFTDKGFASVTLNPDMRTPVLTTGISERIKFVVPKGTNFVVGSEYESEIVLPEGAHWKLGPKKTDARGDYFEATVSWDSETVSTEMSFADRAEVEAKYTLAQRAAMDVYVSGDYELVNQELRASKGDDTKVESEVAEWTHHLDGMVVNEADADVVVYRKIASDYTDFVPKEGLEFVDHAFVSTAATVNDMHDFVNGSFENYQLRIHMPKGSKFAYGNHSEGEILLPRNSKFKVIDYDSATEMWDVEVLETPVNNMPLPDDANFPDYSGLPEVERLQNEIQDLENEKFSGKRSNADIDAEKAVLQGQLEAMQSTEEYDPGEDSVSHVEEVRAIRDEWLAGMTKAQRKWSKENNISGDYLDGNAGPNRGFNEVTQALRGKTAFTDTHQDMVERADAMFEDVGYELPEDTILYRGTKEKLELDEFTDNGYPFASMNKGWAGSYTETLVSGSFDRVETGTLVRLHLPKGTKVLPGANVEEAEFILPRGMHFTKTGTTNLTFKGGRVTEAVDLAVEVNAPATKEDALKFQQLFGQITSGAGTLPDKETHDELVRLRALLEGSDLVDVANWKKRLARFDTLKAKWDEDFIYNPEDAPEFDLKDVVKQLKSNAAPVDELGSRLFTGSDSGYLPDDVISDRFRLNVALRQAKLGESSLAPNMTQLSDPTMGKRFYEEWKPGAGATYADLVTAFDAYIEAHPLAKETTVYRGIRQELSDTLNVGTVFTDKGYSYWSTNEAAASVYQFGEGKRVKITVPEGSPFAVGLASHNEFIAKRGFSFRVVSITDDVIEVEPFLEGDIAPAPPAPPAPKPMLLKEQRDSFDSDNWIFQKKYDGQRAIVTLHNGSVTVHSRTLQDITDQFPEMQELPKLLHLETGDYQFDGELAVFDDAGKTDIDLIQQRRVKGPDGKYNPDNIPIKFVAFDLLWANGDTKQESVEDRIDHLQQLIAPGDDELVFVAPSFTSGTDLFEEVRSRGEEGIVAKLKGSTYEPGKRSPNWIKVKFYKQAEVVIGGWEEGKGERAGHLGAVQLGVYNSDGEFVYVGKLGSGLGGENLDAMEAALKDKDVDASPFGVIDEKLPKGSHFVNPELVLTAEFTDLTDSGKLRQPKFIQIRDDKSANDVTLADLRNSANPPQNLQTQASGSVREFSHGESSGTTPKVIQEEAKTGTRSSDEDEAVDWYAANGFNMLNPWLRSGGNPDNAFKPAHLIYKAQLDRAVARGRLAEDTVVWRGVKPSFADSPFANIHEGMEFKDGGFVSTTLSQYRAYNFAGGFKGPDTKLDPPTGSALFRLILPSGMAFTVGSVSEAELLLGRDLKFKVGKYHDEVDPSYWDLSVIKDERTSIKHLTREGKTLGLHYHPHSPVEDSPDGALFIGTAKYRKWSKANPGADKAKWAKWMKEHPEKVEASRQKERTQYLESVDRARNNWEPFTVADMKIIMEHATSDADIARQLGRSIGSIRTARAAQRRSERG